MIFPNVIHLWFYAATVTKCIRASVTEQAALGQVVKRWYGAGNGAEFSV